MEQISKRAREGGFRLSVTKDATLGKARLRKMHQQTVLEAGMPRKYPEGTVYRPKGPSDCSRARGTFRCYQCQGSMLQKSLSVWLNLYLPRLRELYTNSLDNLFSNCT